MLCPHNESTQQNFRCSFCYMDKGIYWEFQDTALWDTLSHIHDIMLTAPNQTLCEKVFDIRSNNVNKWSLWELSPREIQCCLPPTVFVCLYMYYAYLEVVTFLFIHKLPGMVNPNLVRYRSRKLTISWKRWDTVKTTPLLSMNRTSWHNLGK